MAVTFLGNTTAFQELFKRIAEVPWDDTSKPVSCVVEGARRLLQVVVPLWSLRGCGRYGVDLGIHYPPATDIAGGRSPNVEGDHWSGVAGKTVVTQTHPTHHATLTGPLRTE